jgi:hypothetical protein
MRSTDGREPSSSGIVQPRALLPSKTLLRFKPRRFPMALKNGSAAHNRGQFNRAIHRYGDQGATPTAPNSSCG